MFDLDNTRQISKLFNVTTDWNRIELTFPADVDDGSSPFGDDNAASLEVQFWLHAGTNFTSGTLNSSSWDNNSNTKRAGGIDSFFSSTDNNFFITGVQMEVGPVATDFEQEEISTTLAKCQRYFQTVLKAYGVVHSCNTSGNVYANINFVSKMRAAPSITMGAANTGSLYEKNANRGVSAFTAQNIQAENYQLHTQTSGATAGSAAHLDITPLLYQADAEL